MDVKLTNRIAAVTIIGDSGFMNAPLLPALWSSPSQAFNRKNVARVLDAWYVACVSGDLGPKKPVAVQVLGVPLALWRT